MNQINLRGRAFAPQFLNFLPESRSANALPFIGIMTVLADPVNVLTEINRTSDICHHFLNQNGELISIIPTTKSSFLASSISLIRVVKKEGILL